MSIHCSSGCGRKRSDPAMAAATAADIERGNNGQIDQIVADKIRKDVDQESLDIALIALAL